MLHGAFGDRLGRSFNLGSPPTLVRQTPGGLPVAMTEIQYERRAPGFTLPMASEDAYLIGLQLRDVRHHEVWLAGRLVSDGAWSKGDTIFYDLAHHPVFFCEEPLHQLTFYAPKRAIAEVCDQFDPRESELSTIPGQAICDETIRYIGEALLPYLRNNESARVVDHLLYALCGHVAERYGSKKVVRSRRSSGGLAPWQLRRARELLRDSMTSGVILQDVADACRLSQSAFVKGFKKSTGVPPYQWLLSQRIEWAIELMQSTSLSLVDVALTCGFSDQSHFTRMFAQKMGVSPGAYRRAWPKKAA
jgi:AraC-like DNA-binding protein